MQSKNLLRKLEWLLSCLLAVAALLFAWLAAPPTSLNLMPGADNHLGTLNSETTITPSGFTSLPEGGATSVASSNEIRVTAFSFRPVILNLAVQSGQGKLEVASNGVTIATVEQANLAGVYTFSFVPLKEDNARPEIHLSFTTSGSTPLILTRLDLDFSAQWQPWFAARGDFLPGLLAFLLILLVVAAWLGRKILWLSWLGLAGGLVGVILLTNWLAVLMADGAAGAFNSVYFWEIFFGIVYLLLLVLIIGAAVLPVRNGATLFVLGRPTFAKFQTKRPFLAAALVLSLANAALTLLLFVVPFVQNDGFNGLARFWDGPEYLLAAYTLYDPASPVLHIPQFAQYNPLYYTAHFPLMPLLIRLFSPLFGYIGSEFLLTFLFTCGFAVVLYKFLRDFGYSRYPLWLSFVALLIPLRWLIFHAVGASEPATLFFTMLCLYQFKKGNYWWAGLWAACVELARPNGFFLVIGLGLWLVWQAYDQFRNEPPTPRNSRTLILIAERFKWKALAAIFPTALALLAVFAFYGWRTGDFLAYLHIPEDVKHITPFPFLSLDVGVGRGEGDFYYYGLEAAGLVLLWRQKRWDLFWVGLALALPAFFILHDDVLRYSLPAFPFVFLIPFAAAFESRPARWLVAPTLLAVLIYSWTQLAINQINLADWQQLLKFIG